MATLIHSDCKTPILLDITDYFKFLVNFGVGDDCLRISLGDLIYKNRRRTVKSIFFCPECNSVVKEEKLESVCMNCGEYFHPNNIYKIKDKYGSTIAGEYCESCISELHKTIPIASRDALINVIAKVNIKFGD
jgi:hypothetical protein